MKRARAIIIKGNKILTIKRTKPEVTYWVFPGGGVEEGERIDHALIREIKEELGLDIEVNELAVELTSEKLETRGQKEYFYFCSIIGGEIGTGTGPEFEEDTNYIGKYDIEWLNIKSLNSFDLRPNQVKEIINEL